jgi:hypothetical protein
MLSTELAVGIKQRNELIEVIEHCPTDCGEHESS